MLDVPFLNTKFPITTLMKFEVLYIPFMTLPSLACGAITVKRSQKNSRKQALLKSQARLKNGQSVFYFPEGTRAKDRPIKEFEQIHLPLIKIAYQEQLPVQPISLQGTRELLDSHTLIRPGQPLKMVIHPLIFPQNFTDEITFAKECWSRVKQGSLT
jgi:1-acyl-sn-glycerol-3-phosphate acyltransferase